MKKMRFFALALVLVLMLGAFSGCQTTDAINAAQEAISAAESAGASVTPEQAQQAVESVLPATTEEAQQTAQDIISAISEGATKPETSEKPTEPAKPEDNAPKLRTDGLYCYINDWNNDGLTNNYVMRFYDDGELIFVSMEQSTPTSSYFPQSSWFDREKDYKNLISTYTIDGDYIEFYTDNPAGTVDYWGTIYEDRLVLDSHSNINGHETQGREYVFFPFSEIQGW